MTIFRVMHAEMLKLKRTLAFRMVFVAPVLVVTLIFFILYEKKEFKPDFDLWDSVLKIALNFWAVFMMPLLITLETAMQVWGAGADCVAVARDVICASNPGKRAAEYLAAAPAHR